MATIHDPLKIVSGGGFALMTLAATATLLAATPVWAAGEAFFVSELPGGAAASIAADPDRTEIQVLDLPRGRYLASATAVLASNDPLLHIVDCQFTIDGVLTGVQSSGQIGGDVNNFLTLPMLIGVVLEDQAELAVSCRTDQADIVISQPSPLGALRLSRLEIQSEETEPESE
jgi:hypothetical protein